MKSIKITSQEQWDNLPEKFKNPTQLIIRCDLTITNVPCNSRAVLRGSSIAELRGNSSAELLDNSRAELWDNSRAMLRGNSIAELWGSSSVELWNNSVAYEYSKNTSVKLNHSSVCFTEDKRNRSGNFIIMHRREVNTNDDWLREYGIEENRGKVILYKRVSADFKTQEGTENETSWEIGSVVEHPDWNPSEDECGKGKFHAVPRPYFADQFRSKRGDRYIAIEIDKEDLYAWTDNPSYPYKIGFRKGKVLYECNFLGEKI